MTGLVIALLGAESTGKTTLAWALQAQLSTATQTVAVVPEYLREFCDTHHRTPQFHEQAHIADEQTRRIAAAASTHHLVIADTTALQIAVYSHFVFNKTEGYAAAEHQQTAHHLTLLTATDLPWQPDGIQRSGAHVRTPVDTLLREALTRANVTYSIIMGAGTQRLQAALASVKRTLKPRHHHSTARWQPQCDRCSDPECELREQQGSKRIFPIG
jgi:nicotinamide riboside kinase